MPSRLTNYIIIAISVVCLGISIVYQSRAFIVGYVISTGFYLLYLQKNKLSKKVKLFITIIIVLLIPLLTFLSKSDSSFGRILIYKLSFRILKDSFPEGVGWGNFNIVYGNYQANYFSEGNYTQKELLLADNTKHAFNDYLQLVIETGFLGVLLLFLAVLLFVLAMRKALKSGSRNYITLPIAIIQVIAMGIAAMLTHVFELFFFQCLMAITVLIIVVHANVFKPNIVPILTLLLLLSLLTWNRFGHYIAKSSAYNRLEQSKILYQSGYMKETYNQLVNLYPTLNNDEDYLSLYSNVLLTLDKHEEALKVLSHLLEISNTSFYCVQLGDCLFHTGNYEHAERAYVKAINLVPGKFNSRLSLFEFYCQTGQYQKAVPCGKAILNLPIKVPSARVNYIREYVSGKITRL